MASYSYTYYSDTKNHGGWTATMQVSCGHYLTTTNDTVTINMEGAAQYSSNNATGYGVHVQVGHDAVSSPSYSKRQADGYGVLNYSNWVGSAKGSFAFTRTHSAYNVWIWSAAWGETVSGYGAAPESAGGGKTITIPARPSYSVTFNANGGSGAPAAQTKWYNESLTLSSTKPTRTGYTFNGWNTKSDGSGTNYAAGASYTGNAALTLYAKWTANTYAISYNGNGSTSGSTSAQTKTYDVALTLRSNGYTRTNYVFKNWNTAANGSGTAYSAGASYTANAAATMYAQWYAPYTITPDPNGGTLASGCAALTKVYNTAKTIWAAGLNPTRAGYNFTGWNTSAAGTGTAYAAGSSYTANANATLYAQWEIAHSSPTISNLLVQRCLQNGTLADDGEYCKVSAAVSVDHSTTGYTDTKLKTVTVQVGSNAAESVTVSTTATSANISFVSANQVSLTSAYSVKLTVTDSHNFSSYRTSNLSVAYFTMHFKEGGKGIAIGKKSVTNNLFDVNMNTKVTGTLDTTGKITTPSDVQGNYLYAVSGNVYSKDSTADIGSGTNNVSAAVYRAFGSLDKNGQFASYMQAAFRTDGSVGFSLAARNRGTGSNVDNGVTFNVANDGTRTISVNDAAAWRNGIGALGATTANGYEGMLTRDGTSNVWIRTTQNGLIPYASGGNSSSLGTTSWPFKEVWAKKVSGFRTQLYNNANGSNSTITLSATAANYNHLRIYFYGKGGSSSDWKRHASTDVYTPDGKVVSLSVSTPINSGYNGVVIHTKVVTISAKSITSTKYYSANIDTGTGSAASNEIYIVRVEGWNE